MAITWRPTPAHYFSSVPVRFTDRPGAPEAAIEEAIRVKLVQRATTVWVMRQAKLPSGRIPDLVCLYDDGDQLLAVECKADVAGWPAVAQLAGYVIELMAMAPALNVRGVLVAPDFRPDVERWIRGQQPRFVLWHARAV